MKTSPAKLGYFPKERYKSKPNDDTNFVSKTESATLPASPNWDGYYALQLDYAPAQPSEGINQTITHPVVTCLTDSTTRTVTYSPVAGGQPAAGTVFINLDTGIIQFNSADAGKNFQVQYYAKYHQIEAEDFNRCWAAGPEYLVGDDAYCDYATIEEAIAVASGSKYSTISLRKNLTVNTAITINKKIKIQGNGYTLTKGSTPQNCFIVSEDCIIENCHFSGWSTGGDITIYTAVDKTVRIVGNKFTNCVDAENISSVSSSFSITGNIPANVNLGSTPNTEIEVTDGTTSGTFTQLEFPSGTVTDMGSGVAKISNIAPSVSKSYTAQGSITAFTPVFFNSSDATKVENNTYTSYSTDKSKQFYYAGIAGNAATTGQAVAVHNAGLLSGFSGLTKNNYYFLNRDNVLTNDPTHAVICIGRAASSSSMILGEQPPVGHRIMKSVNASNGIEQLGVELGEGQVGIPYLNSLNPLTEIGTTQSVGGSSSGQMQAVGLYHNQFLIQKNNTFYYIRKNADGTITNIANLSHTSDGTHTVTKVDRIFRISSYQVVAFYTVDISGSPTYKCCVLDTSSGTSISRGSVTTVNSGVDGQDIAIELYYSPTSISTARFAKFRMDGSNNLQSAIVSVAKLTSAVTVGSESAYAFGAEGTTGAYMATVVGTKVVVVVGTNTNDLKAVIYDVSGISTCTQTGSAQTVATDSAGTGGFSANIKNLNTTNMILSYMVSGNLKTKAVTISGTTLTAGSSTTVVSSISVYVRIILQPLNSEGFIVSPSDSTNSAYTLGNKKGTTTLESYSTLSPTNGFAFLTPGFSYNEWIAGSFASSNNCVQVAGNISKVVGVVVGLSGTQALVELKGKVNIDRYSSSDIGAYRQLADLVYIKPNGALTDDASLAGKQIGMSVIPGIIEVK